MLTVSLLTWWFILFFLAVRFIRSVSEHFLCNVFRSSFADHKWRCRGTINWWQLADLRRWRPLLSGVTGVIIKGSFFVWVRYWLAVACMCLYRWDGPRAAWLRDTIRQQVTPATLTATRVSVAVQFLLGSRCLCYFLPPNSFYARISVRTLSFGRQLRTIMPTTIHVENYCHASVFLCVFFFVHWLWKVVLIHRYLPTNQTPVADQKILKRGGRQFISSVLILRLCSCLTALCRYINFVLLFFFVPSVVNYYYY